MTGEKGPRSFTPEAYQAALSAALRGDTLVLRPGRALGLYYTDVYRDRVAPDRRIATLTPEQGDSIQRHLTRRLDASKEA